jgi:hypothetical protein
MNVTSPKVIKVVQASNLPGTLDEFVADGPAFEFFQWGLLAAPTSEKIDIYRLDVIHHYADPELKRVIDLTVQITNKETGAAIDISLTRRSNDRFAGFHSGKIVDIRDLPAFFDGVTDLPKSPPPRRAFTNVHDFLKSRISERAQGVKTSFEDDDPDPGFKL